MKIDRLYGITVYLMNHGKTPAAKLAKKFEVSIRTIQRDIDALCAAGIPVSSESGAMGGYSVSDTFRLSGQLATKEDYSFILTALKGFSTAVRDPKIDAALEKVSNAAGINNSSIILDFSSLKEGDPVLFSTLKKAILLKRPVSFSYTNADNVSRIHTVEPIALVYRWYAWYLLAFSIYKNDYRTYKLKRMEGLTDNDRPFTKEHPSAEDILAENDKTSPRCCTEIIVRCKPEARAKAVEYLNGEITAEFKDGSCEMRLYVIENEHFWFGTLLSLGSGVEIKEPGHIRQRVLEAARNIVSLYN